MENEYEYHYIVSKLGFTSRQLNVLIFDETFDFNNIVKALVAHPNNLFAVSGGKCKIFVDSLSVECYRAKGTVLTPALEDSVTVANFLFRGAKQ